MVRFSPRTGNSRREGAVLIENGVVLVTGRVSLRTGWFPRVGSRRERRILIENGTVLVENGAVLVDNARNGHFSSKTGRF